ncbi:transcription elongation factor GreAB [Pseudomonas sp. NPDC007930]|uniref:GreA/GreB family elongation factor n=1 Tax=Pseudomonas sp. NPDC007930 TaxID=3364417 RepID=UPI0036F0707C
MDKHALLGRLIATLAQDHEVLLRAVQTAREAATHEESKAENKYDTRGLEASYLAHGQARRLEEIAQALQRFRALVVAPHAAELGIRTGDLVHLADGQGRERWVFLGPDAAGLQGTCEAGPCLVITSQSPLGQALHGQGEGAEVKLAVGGGQHYEVLAVY